MRILSVVLSLVLISVSYVTYAEYDYTKPNYILLDKDKKPIPNVSASRDDTRCIHKANDFHKTTKLPSAKYFCAQEPIPITITGVQESPPNDTVLLTWTAPTENTDSSNLTDLDGFKIYYGINPNELTTVIVIEDAVTRKHELTGLAANTYYFGITAVNANRIESSLSAISSKVIN